MTLRTYPKFSWNAPLFALVNGLFALVFLSASAAEIVGTAFEDAVNAQESGLAGAVAA